MNREIVLNVVEGLLVAVAAYAAWLRPMHLRWGATSQEVSRPLPGDDLVPHPKGKSTHAITINSPAPNIWPWLVQLGQNKGGFYSYSWLENLVGCHMRNTDRIVGEWQDV